MSLLANLAAPGQHEGLMNLLDPARVDTPSTKSSLR